MKLTSQYTRIIIAIILGIILGVIISFAFGNWLWLPLMIGACFIFSLFCRETSEIPEKEEKKFYDQ
jgi:galactitol-specific phosphotransferase system IIC component